MSEWKRAKEALGRFETAVLVTQAEGGRLRARPMAIAGIGEAGELWFLTAEAAGKVHEIEEHAEVNVVCQEGGSCVSISGKARLVHDRAKISELWRDSFRTWFPNGKEDPGICLIRVSASEAEIWEEKTWRSSRHPVMTAYV